MVSLKTKQHALFSKEEAVGQRKREEGNKKEYKKKVEKKEEKRSRSVYRFVSFLWKSVSYQTVVGSSQCLSLLLYCFRHRRCRRL